MIQKEKIPGYSVIAYDKDNDVFICYGKYAEEHDAMKKAKELKELLDKEELKRTCSDGDGTEEPMDWLEIYWNWNEDDEQIIWGSYNN
ncbi:hypothetical protein [uncultured Eubacterium sp.]|uniref:hypothetical protein n=1 Tax=uncultured Eubacterium sp. TaxID=165185 RepID=UPI002599BC79|nr:hypothetical protein [uncultured Eubacterium sp.]